MRCRSRSCRNLLAHRHASSRCPRTCSEWLRRSCGISSQKRITGSERSCSYPRALKLAVPSRKYRPAPGSSPSQRAANTRRKCPLEKGSTSPSMARTRRITRSARGSDLVWGLASRAGATSAREPKPASSHVQTARCRGLVNTAASLNPSSRSPRRTASASP